MRNEIIKYQHQETECEAYVAFPDGEGPFPCVLVAHAWAGRDEQACKKAEKLTEFGYVGFALDMFGSAKLGSSYEENGQLIQPFMENRQLLLDRMLAAYETAKTLDEVDSNQIGVMGFCFGGLCALDLARSGADVKGAVAFHALLDAPEGVTAGKISSKILALHGHDDPMATPEAALAFQTEMTNAGADWQMHIYGQTMHAFTTPTANDSDFGAVYSEAADRRSWRAMTNFWREIF